MNAALMSREQYAAHRGVSPQAVSKMIASGKIRSVREGRRHLIDPVLADQALAENRERVSMLGGDDDDDGVDDGTARPMGPAPSFGGATTTVGLTKARTATEVYRAKLAELEFKQRSGTLVEIVDVQRSMEIAGEAIVRELEMLPTFADEFGQAMAAGGVEAVRRALKSRVRDLRGVIAARMRILAAGEADDGVDDEEDGGAVEAPGEAAA